MDYSLPGSSVHGDSQGKNTGMDNHVPLQEMGAFKNTNAGISAPEVWIWLFLNWRKAHYMMQNMLSRLKTAASKS